MICVPAVVSAEEDALLQLKSAEKAADLIELRLDLLPRKAWPLLLREKKKPYIVTLRPERQGGRFIGEETERIRLLEETLAFRPSFIDVEWDSPPRFIERLKKRKGKETSLILSCHDFHGTPDDLEGIWKKIDSRGADLVKIATYANRFEDNLRILKLVQGHAGKIIAFCMGPVGVPSRILTLRWGGFLTYGCLEEGKESAPGQISADDLREIYRVGKTEKDTPVFGLIGNPLFHSLSPVIHNAAFQELGLRAVYIPFQLPDLDRLLPGLRSLGVRGLSVTIPYKERIMPLLDEVDEKARAIGAVNTVFLKDDKWVGTNTDARGAWEALERTGLDLQARHWTLIGAGGVARAVAFSAGAYGNPSSLTFLGRSQGRLDLMVRDMRRLFRFPVDGALLAEVDLAGKLGQTEILVNCTPLGMAPRVDETPIPCHLLSSSALLFDTIYNPLETRFLKEGKKRGCRTVSGFQMFLLQAAAQFELWTGERPPLRIMEERALERLTR